MERIIKIYETIMVHLYSLFYFLFYIISKYTCNNEPDYQTEHKAASKSIER